MIVMFGLIVAGLVGLVGGYFVVKYWTQITDWIEENIPKIRSFWDTIKVFVPHAAAMYGDIILDGVERIGRIMHKLYHQDPETKEWFEDTTTNQVPESEIPSNYRLNQYEEKDITAELEDETGLKIEL